MDTFVEFICSVSREDLFWSNIEEKCRSVPSKYFLTVPIPFFGLGTLYMRDGDKIYLASRTFKDSFLGSSNYLFVVLDRSGDELRIMGEMRRPLFNNILRLGFYLMCLLFIYGTFSDFIFNGVDLEGVMLFAFGTAILLSIFNFSKMRFFTFFRSRAERKLKLILADIASNS
jgi:hypothetical protein